MELKKCCRHETDIMKPSRTIRTRHSTLLKCAVNIRRAPLAAVPENSTVENDKDAQPIVGLVVIDVEIALPTNEVCVCLGQVELVNIPSHRVHHINIILPSSKRRLLSEGERGNPDSTSS